MPDISHNNFANNERVKNLCKTLYKSPLLIWQKDERQLVDQHLASITLPFEDQIRRDQFETVNKASAEDLRGYVLSWSGFNTLFNVDKESALKFLDFFDRQIKDIFGDQGFSEIELNIHFKYYLLMARKS